MAIILKLFQHLNFLLYVILSVLGNIVFSLATPIEVGYHFEIYIHICHAVRLCSHPSGPGVAALGFWTHDIVWRLVHIVQGKSKLRLRSKEELAQHRNIDKETKTHRKSKVLVKLRGQQLPSPRLDAAFAGLSGQPSPGRTSSES